MEWYYFTALVLLYIKEGQTELFPFWEQKFQKNEKISDFTDFVLLSYEFTTIWIPKSAREARFRLRWVPNDRWDPKKIKRDTEADIYGEIMFLTLFSSTVWGL